MKTFLSTTALAMAFAGGLHAQELSGEITLVSYSAIFQDRYTEAVIKPFEAAHPGVKVNFATVGNSAQMLGSVRAQAGDPQTDVVIFDVSTGLIGNKEGLFEELSVEEIPNLADLVPQATVQEGFGPAVTFDKLVILYNAQKVTPAPTSVTALWDEAYEGRIGIAANPNIQGAALTAIVATSEGEDFTQSIDKAVEKLAELAPSVATFDPKPDGYTLVMNDTVDFATGWNARAQVYSAESNGKLGVMIPEEGTVAQTNTINLVKGAPNPELAKAFIDYALSPEAQKAFTESLFYAPTNAKADISDEALAKVGSLEDTIAFDWAWYATVSDRWNQIWKRGIISAGN